MTVDKNKTKTKNIYSLTIIKMKNNLRKSLAWLVLAVMLFTNLANAYDLTQSSVTFTMPDHNVELQARSEANTYTIAFNANWWTGSMSNMPMTYDQTGALTANSFIKTWYTFQWWNTNSWATTARFANWEDVSNLTSTDWATVTLYAIWKANTYKVSFDKNEGVDDLNLVVWTMSNQDFTYDTTWALTANGYTRAWYEFLWWSRNPSDTSATYTDSQDVINLTTTSWAVVPLYAIWSANDDTKYTVNHYLMKVDWTYPENPTYSGEFTATTYEVVSPTPRSDAWFTLSWDTQTWHVKWDGTTVFDYYYIRNDYTVTLHAWRWIQSVSWDWSYKFNEVVTVSATYKPWYENLTWTWTYDTDTFNMPATGVDMTASATPITYSITYDVWSGTITWQKTTYNVEENFTLVDPTRTWYDFVWWSGTNLTSPTSWLVISGVYWNLSYVAVWEARSDVTYTVHHMHKKVWEAIYQEVSQDVYNTGTADAELILENLKKDVDGDCVTYAWWSLTESSSWLTSPITTTTVLPDGSREIYLYYTRNVYNVILTKDDHIDSVTLNGDTGDTVTKAIECGATVSIDADPSEWYHFLRRDDIGTFHLN